MDQLTVTADDETSLSVGFAGSGPDVVALSGGPGCVHYLADERLAPRGYRTWFPDPRGVGESDGGSHGMTQAVADLEALRRAAGVDRWIVLGHSWGSDLIDFVVAVHESLKADFQQWIHRPELFRTLADSPVPMRFVGAGGDIRPQWPLQQLAALVPVATYVGVPGVVHNFWSTNPQVWVDAITEACNALVVEPVDQGANG